MAVRSYTIEQLKALQLSPLVAKPENLPAIEQWIEYVYMEQDGVREKLRIPHSETAQSNQQNRQQLADGTTRNAARQQRPGLAGGTGGESSPMGSFSTGRPPLGARKETQRGQNGGEYIHLCRQGRAAAGGKLTFSEDDIALGPPRTMFPSSRNVSKLVDAHDKTAGGDTTAGDEPESARSRFFSDRQLNRRSINEKDGNENRGSWSFRKERGDDGEEQRGFGRHVKDHDNERRNGYGERHDPRWTRDDRRQHADRERPVGGWRDREAARRQREDHNEKEPEWFSQDDPLVKQDQELNFGVARNADEFQKWKESMKKGKTDAEPRVEETSQPPAPEPKSQAAPLKLEIDNSIFAGWGSGASTTTPASTAPSAGTVAPKYTPGKSGKTSRFASMFKPVEPEPSPAPVKEPSPELTNETVKTTAEDHEGFNKMLQMLNQSKLTRAPRPFPAADPEPSSPPPPLKSMTSNGTVGKSKSRFANMFAQKSPDRMQSPQQSGGSIGPDSMFDGSMRGSGDEPLQHQLFGSRLPERQTVELPASRSQLRDSQMSPDHSGIPFNALREQQPRPGSGRVDAAHIFDPPSRGAPSPDIMVQNVLAQQQRRQHGTSMESQQLLNLLRNKGGVSSRPQSGQAQPNVGTDALQLQHLLEHQHQNLGTEPHQPKPRVPTQAPGVFEEQLMRNYPQELPRQANVPEMTKMHERAMQDTRRPMQQRVPPGFFNEDLFIQQQQQQQQQRQAQQQAQLQRMHSESLLQQTHQHHQQQQPPLRMSGLPSLPHMQIPGSQSHQAQFQQPPGDFPHQLTSPISGGGPPGFQQMPRHPPGFHNPNAFSQGQRDGPPPGFGGMTSPTNGPPGFFQQPPPGFATPQQMRGPGDQRGYEGFQPGIMPRR
ncbi:hypothetical protein AC579_6635 [Pseudocercospora musae]|uniref:Uncharacterized protein n=1 Tax=Pseudocercospora musae TaxID=113226 RepID=A0A139I0A7_9PEZI|nr:hypothetical protein AC579_6635 [Pseudocercospora musae]